MRRLRSRSMILHDLNVLAYRNAQRSELLAEHFKKATDIGRESALLGQPAKKFGLATVR
jgi:hypothetical protein